MATTLTMPAHLRNLAEGQSTVPVMAYTETVCPECGDMSWEPVANHGNYELWQCDICAMIVADNRNNY